jgi:hypothetical protein
MHMHNSRDEFRLFMMVWRVDIRGVRGPGRVPINFAALWRLKSTKIFLLPPTPPHARAQRCFVCQTRSKETHTQYAVHSSAHGSPTYSSYTSEYAPSPSTWTSSPDISARPAVHYNLTMSALEHPTIKLLAVSAVLAIIISIARTSYRSLWSELFHLAPVVLIIHHGWLAHRLHKGELGAITQPHTLILQVLLGIYAVTAVLFTIRTLDLLLTTDCRGACGFWVERLVKLLFGTGTCLLEVAVLWRLVVTAESASTAEGRGDGITGAGAMEEGQGYGAV